MDLKDYLINCIIEEKELINQLLYIDNSVQYTSVNYEQLVLKLQQVNAGSDIVFKKSVVAITDGEPETVFRALINISDLKDIFINRTSLGINKYLVNRANAYYEEEKIKLDSSKDYRKYINYEYSIVISGFDVFVEEISKEFGDKDITIL